MITYKTTKGIVNKRALERRATYWRTAYKSRISKDGLLSKQQQEQIISFYGPYTDTIGEVDIIFHNFYLEKTGSFDYRYMPIDFFYCFIDPFYNDWDMAPYIDNKANYWQIFQHIDQPEAYLYRVNNIWTDGNNNLISDEEIEKILKSDKEMVIKQANESEGGKNIFFIDGSYNEKKGKFYSACKQIKKDIVVQQLIKQSHIISSVNPSSINTIRILSLLTQKEVKIYSAILRMGVNYSRVDNISRGGIACGIANDGRLKKYAYNYRGEKFLEHPTTKVEFNKIVIPNYEKAVELVKRAHPAIPNFRLVSWDIAFNENEKPLLVEANLCYGELNLHQLCNGPVFGDDTQAVIDEVFEQR